MVVIDPIRCPNDIIIVEEVVVHAAPRQMSDCSAVSDITSHLSNVLAFVRNTPGHTIISTPVFDHLYTPIHLREETPLSVG